MATKSCSKCGRFCAFSEFHQGTRTCKDCRRLGDQRRRECQRNAEFSQLMRKWTPAA